MMAFMNAQLEPYSRIRITMREYPVTGMSYGVEIGSDTSTSLSIHGMTRRDLERLADQIRACLYEEDILAGRETMWGPAASAADPINEETICLGDEPQAPRG